MIFSVNSDGFKVPKATVRDRAEEIDKIISQNFFG
jgi:hypothetical protein